MTQQEIEKEIEEAAIKDWATRGFVFTTQSGTDHLDIFKSGAKFGMELLGKNKYELGSQEMYKLWNLKVLGLTIEQIQTLKDVYLEQNGKLPE